MKRRTDTEPDDMPFPEPDRPLAESRLLPFDWTAWMDEIEEARQRWVRDCGQKHQVDLERHRERFRLP
jgi:hypothetical protein